MNNLFCNLEFLGWLGKVGGHLTSGKLGQVELAHLPPPAIGWATKTDDERGAVFVDVRQSTGTIVGVFLHECAHLVRHWDSVGHQYEQIKADIMAGANSDDPVKIHEQYPQREIEAHELQMTWTNWALERVEPYAAKHPEARGEPPLLVFLKILADYPTENKT